jgi:4'-phosphopantetheinyl transferase
MEAWLVDLEADATAASPETYAGILTADELVRGAAYLYEPSASRFLRARLAIRRLLARRLGESPGTVRIVCTPMGKPYLPDHPWLHVNWSRSEDLLLLGMAEHEPIGVDVEWLRAVPSAADVLATVYPQLPSSAKPEVFLPAWTILEAAVKATGRGLADGARDVVLDFAPDGTVALGGITGPGGGPWHGRTELLTVTGHSRSAVAAFVFQGPPDSVVVRHWNPWRGEQ